jgi:DNA-binding NtrC family response regulator
MLIVHAGGERRWRRLEFWPYHSEKGSLLGLIGLVREPDDAHQAADSEALRLRSELLEVRERLQARHGTDSLIGQGPSHRRLLEQVTAAAATSVPVLIVGEPGTGKRTVARTIHAKGPRPHSPLVPFDCATLPPEVLERELFGTSGVDMSRLALGDGSSVLLGDILDLPRDLQGRLARALEGPRVRLLATTAVDPEQALRDERLRADLYFAVTTITIRLTPIRERLDALPLLAQHLLERCNLRGDRRRVGFSQEAMNVLVGYDWPGNLRELARVIEEAHDPGTSDLVQSSDLPASIRGHLASAYSPPPMPVPFTPLDQMLEQLEKRLIEQALVRARENKSRAAELLGISRPRLYRRIKELAIPVEPDPAEEPPAIPGQSA